MILYMYISADKGDDDDPPLSLVSKQIAVHQLPPVLILHLKRFSIEPDGIFKDTQHIKFPLKLNMAPYCTAQCIEVCNEYNIMKYVCNEINNVYIV